MNKLKGFAALLAVAGIIGGLSFAVWLCDGSDPDPPATAPPSGGTKQTSRLSVELITANRSSIQAWVFAEGTARSTQREYLTFEATGRVTFVGPEKPGTAVKQGEVLAELDKRTFAADVDAALAAIEEAKTQVEAAVSDSEQAQTSATLEQRQYERVLQLYQSNASSVQELEQAKAAMENARSASEAAKARGRAVASNIAVAEAKLKQAQVYLENAQIVSPIDGIVAYMNIQEGFYFTQNFVKTSNESEALQTVPFVVIDPSQYEVIVNVPSFDAQRIKVGQQVIVLPGGTSDHTILQTLEGDQPPESKQTAAAWRVTAEVYAVNPAINPGGRSVQVKIRTSGDVAELQDGMFVTCCIATEVAEDAIVAPTDAFLYEENKPYVFVYDESTRTVARRDIKFGIRGLSRYEIASGIQPGDRLVTSGRYKLVNGTPVRVIEAEITPAARVD